MDTQPNKAPKIGGMNCKEMIMLVMLYDNKVVSPNQLTDLQKETCETLINSRGTVKVDEDGNYTCTPNGKFVVEVFRSNVSFDLLLSKLSNRHITLLQDKILKIAEKRNIHLNVVFQNLDESTWDKLLSEITQADEVRVERETGSNSDVELAPQPTN